MQTAGPICAGVNVPSFETLKKRKQETYSRAEGQDFEKQRLLVEEIFSGWNEKQRQDALLDLIERANLNQDRRWSLLCKLESTLKCNPMDVLPPELGLYVFSFLERKDLVHAAQVNTQWKALAYDRSLLISKIQEGYLYCQTCTALIGKDEDILCRKYRLDYSLAYHMKNIYNVELGKTDRVEFSSGIFQIAAARCRKCKTDVGVKYLEYLGPAGTNNNNNNNNTATTTIHINNNNNNNNTSTTATPRESENKVGTFLLKKKTVMSPGEPQHVVVAACSKCNHPVGKEQNIISWSYRLRNAQAYQFTSLQDIELGESTEVSYSSGNYTVADTCCANCKEPLGVKYLEAADGENAYKVGTYLVEKPKVKIISVPVEMHKPRLRSSGSSEDPATKIKKERRPSFLSLFSFLRKST